MNNSKFLPQSPFPPRHSKKNYPVTLCQLSSRLCQEPLFPPKSIINVCGLPGLQLLSHSRHLWESVPQASIHRPALATIDMPLAQGEGKEPTASLLPRALCFTSPLPESHACWKPVVVSSLLNNEGQCQLGLPLFFLQPPCLAMGQNLQSWYILLFPQTLLLI